MCDCKCKTEKPEPKPYDPVESLREWDAQCRRARAQSRQHALDNPGDYVIAREGEYFVI